jgi:hypothetical protein
LAGAVAGALTGLIHTKLKINALLAGILVMTALYSVNLTILGRSNLPLNLPTCFNALNITANPNQNSLLILIGFVLVSYFIDRLSAQNRFWDCHARYRQQRAYDPRTGCKYRPDENNRAGYRECAYGAKRLFDGAASKTLPISVWG